METTVRSLDFQITLDVDPDDWVLVPRIALVSSDRQKRRWSREVAVPIGARFGYRKRSEWTVTLAKMLLVYADFTYFTKAALLVRVGHEPGVAPQVRATTVDVFDEPMKLDESAEALANPTQRQRRPPLIEYPNLPSGAAAVCATRYFDPVDIGPYAGVTISCGTEDSILMFETAVSDDAAVGAAKADTLAIARSTRIQRRAE